MMTQLFITADIINYLGCALSRPNPIRNFSWAYDSSSRKNSSNCSKVIVNLEFKINWEVVTFEPCYNYVEFYFRFAINLQCGPNTEPRDDIAIHFSPQFDTRKVIRNTLQNLMWGPEESMGYFPFTPGQSFEVILLCEANHFKVSYYFKNYMKLLKGINFLSLGYL